MIAENDSVGETDSASDARRANVHSRTQPSRMVRGWNPKGTTNPLIVSCIVTSSSYLLPIVRSTKEGDPLQEHSSRHHQ